VESTVTDFFTSAANSGSQKAILTSNDSLPETVLYSDSTVESKFTTAYDSNNATISTPNTNSTAP